MRAVQFIQKTKQKVFEKITENLNTSYDSVHKSLWDIALKLIMFSIKRNFVFLHSSSDNVLTACQYTIKQGGLVYLHQESKKH